MKIELKQPYRSISTLIIEDLPDFAILIGRNGVGKTQLLGALKEGQAVIPTIGVSEIELYDMDSFRPPNTDVADRNTSQFARDTANAYLISSPGGRPPIETAAAIFDECSSEIECGSGVQARDDFESNLRDEVQNTHYNSLLLLNRERSPYKKKLYDQVLGPLSLRGGDKGQRQSSNSSYSNPLTLVTAAMNLNGKLPHELTRDDIMRASYHQGDTISNSVSAVFMAYKIDQYLAAHRRIETESAGFGDLMAQYRSEFPPPWEVLREVLSAMRDAAGDDGLFDFDFSDPDNGDLPLDNLDEFSFKAEMTNRTTGTRYELDALSSGERILMGLCLASFNHQYLGLPAPKLLLLDELDAVLHPSMVTALVATLGSLFVSKGTRVLMTSHSPMTVAALDEVAIFRVFRTGGCVEVSSATKTEAIHELSEGLATVDVGLKIAANDEAKVTILTEGNNVKHLKRWAHLYFPKDVHVFEGLESYSSDSQLLAYGRLLGKVNTNTHFVVVWDCDAARKAETLRGELPSGAKVTPFAFPSRENTIAQNGIENNYDEDILEPYSTKTTGNDGKLLSRGFQSNRKTEFANHVLREGVPEYFINFRDLHDIVSGILGPTEKA